MANKTYKIIIKNESGTGTRKAVAGNGGASESGTPDAAATERKELVKGLVAYGNYIKPFAKQIIQHEVDIVELRTGSEKLQQRVSFGYQMATSALGIVENIAIGAAIGNLPGAIIGAVMGLTTWGIGIANRQDTINLQRINEDASLRLMDVRAGGTLSTYSQSRGGRQ